MTATQKTAIFCNEPEFTLDFLSPGIFRISSYHKTGQMVHLIIFCFNTDNPLKINKRAAWFHPSEEDGLVIGRLVPYRSLFRLDGEIKLEYNYFGSYCIKHGKISERRQEEYNSDNSINITIINVKYTLSKVYLPHFSLVSC